MLLTLTVATFFFPAFQELSNKLGAVAAIDALVGTASMQAEATKKVFSNHLSNTLCTSTSYHLLEKVRLFVPGMH